MGKGCVELEGHAVVRVRKEGHSQARAWLAHGSSLTAATPAGDGCCTAPSVGATHTPTPLQGLRHATQPPPPAHKAVPERGIAGCPASWQGGWERGALQNIHAPDLAQAGRAGQCPPPASVDGAPAPRRRRWRRRQAAVGVAQLRVLPRTPGGRVGHAAVAALATKGGVLFHGGGEGRPVESACVVADPAHDSGGMEARLCLAERTLRPRRSMSESTLIPPAKIPPVVAYERYFHSQSKARTETDPAYSQPDRRFLEGGTRHH